MQFQKATKKACKAKVALFGPSGAGKTFSALRVAKGMGGTVALIDTEYGRASKYSDRFEFDTIFLDDQSIDGYINCMGVAAKAGYDILIIDSLSHAWKHLVAEVDRIAAASYNGNTWRAWSEGNPKQDKMTTAILKFPGHILATIRSRTDWVVESGKNGKSGPRRVGLVPEQGKGIEYEFDFLISISQEHIGSVIKDTSGRFQDVMLDPPDEDFGYQLRTWVEDAPAPEQQDQSAKQGLFDAIQREVNRTRFDMPDLLRKKGYEFIDEMTVDEMQKTLDWLKKKPTWEEEEAS